MRISTPAPMSTRWESSSMNCWRARPLEWTKSHSMNFCGGCARRSLPSRVPRSARRTRRRPRWPKQRQPKPVALAREIRGDLDSITLKALEKDRSRRYGSPSDLAADIGRHLNNEAVLAVRPTAAYRARKFARRYRVALATASRFLLVLLVAAGHQHPAERPRQPASGVSPSGERLSAERSAGTGQHQSGQAKPDPDLKVRTALDRAAQHRRKVRSAT